MVGIEGEYTPLYQIPEMARTLECGKQLPIIGRPLLLIGFKLGAIKSQWLPSLRSTLFEDAANGFVRGVGGQSESGAGSRMME